MNEKFSRSAMILGETPVDLLSKKSVIVFGVGGVGGYVCEALIRSGVGKLTIVDKDEVDTSNFNRQIIALDSTNGKDKTEVMKRRLEDINPKAKIEGKKCFFLPENQNEFDFSQYDYVVDAVDTVTAKLLIIEKATKSGTPVISSMGTGNKLYPEMLKVADIYDTSVCPLARIMRKELRKRNLEKLKVVYSEEEPITGNKNNKQADDEYSKRSKDVPGSMIFVPATAGILMAREIVLDLIKN